MTVSTSLSTHKKDTTTGFSGVCTHVRQGLRQSKCLDQPWPPHPRRFTLHTSAPSVGACIYNRFRANGRNSHPNLTPTTALLTLQGCLSLCVLNLWGRTLMLHYGHQSSCLLTITDDETDSGHAVTDNGVQGSFYLCSQPICTQTVGSLCCAAHLFLPLSWPKPPSLSR